MQQSTFEMVVDGVPYMVEAVPFTFNTETRYTVKFGGEEHVFTWDPTLSRYTAIDDDAASMPGVVERAISQRLQSGRYS